MYASIVIFISEFFIKSLMKGIVASLNFVLLLTLVILLWEKISSITIFKRKEAT